AHSFRFMGSGLCCVRSSVNEPKPYPTSSGGLWPKLQNLRNYMTVKEAAAFLGVSPKTLRNWDRTDKAEGWTTSSSTGCSSTPDLQQGCRPLHHKSVAHVPSHPLRAQGLNRDQDETRSFRCAGQG